MVDAGCKHVFMEVSSHALDQGRVAGLDFDVAVFSNMSHDHLDYHGSFKEYVWAKKRLFDMLDVSATAIINVDDKRGTVMVQNCAATVKSYSLRTMADYRTKVLSDTIEGLHLVLAGQEVFCRMSGRYNAYNLTAVLATADALGDDPVAILPAISGLSGAEGRLERVAVDGNDKVAFVDYAHTPDALENVLKTLRQTRQDDQSLIVVFGAGGDRDKAKRAVMAKVAATLADRVILTSDNPRTESPESILDDLEAGIPADKAGSYIRISDRAHAIKTAVMIAGSRDIILVAGKGHEKYQDIAGVKHPFDDKEVLRQALILR
jgi:UDP-N-acetylmuramoyl-L-alanyl-D-glutamate--2,6-diaminopimelate ligase